MRALVLLLALSFVLLALPISTAQTGDVTKPKITDTSDGLPGTNETFRLLATVTDDVAVDIVRFYVYFKVGHGISTPEYPPVQKLTATGYEGIVQVPFNATVMYYTISAGDTSANWNITDVLNRDVEDTIPPFANHTGQDTINLGQPYSMDASNSEDNIGVVNYSWTFTYGGVVTTLYGQAAEFNFTLAGPYTITLTVEDSWNNWDTDIFTLQTNDTIPPVADAGIDLFVIVGHPASFDASDSFDNVGITEFTWSFLNNGSLMTLNGQVQSHTFWETGDYPLTLEVRDAAGNTDSVEITVHVLQDPDQGESMPWWTLALLAMVLVVIAVSVYLIRN